MSAFSGIDAPVGLDSESRPDRTRFCCTRDPRGPGSEFSAGKCGRHLSGMASRADSKLPSRRVPSASQQLGNTSRMAGERNRS